MSYIHQLLNALLRGLVISAVLGLERTYSNDLHNQPSDAAHVATTGKHQSVSSTSVCSLFTHVLYNLPPPSHHPIFGPSGFLRESRGMPCASGLNAESLISFRHLFFYAFCTLSRNADGLKGFFRNGYLRVSLSTFAITRSI